MRPRSSYCSNASIIITNKFAQHVETAEELRIPIPQPPAVIIPIGRWSRVTEKAVRLAFLLSDDITGVHINMEGDDGKWLEDLWREKIEKPARAARRAVPKLRFLDSPYRWLYQPIVDFVKTVEDEKPGRVVAIIIPELVERARYTYLLHPRRLARLRPLEFRIR